MGRRETPAKAILRVLRKHNATIDGECYKKHAKIKWTYRGEKRMTTLAQTGSDRRTMLNSVALIRRQLRSIDTLIEEKRNERPDSKRNSVRR